MWFMRSFCCKLQLFTTWVKLDALKKIIREYSVRDFVFQWRLNLIGTRKLEVLLLLSSTLLIVALFST